MNGDFDLDLDDLDRALFALPLETPPAGLRAAILRATVEAPASLGGAPLRTWEIVALAFALAVTGALVAAILRDGSLPQALARATLAGATALGDATVLMWLLIGGAVAAWLTLGDTLVVPTRRRS